MIKKLLRSISLFVILIGCDSLDSTGTGTIYGTVTYGDGRPVENADVEVSGKGGGYTVTTDYDGHYSVPGLPQGTYSVVVTKDDETRSKVIELRQGSFSCERPEERADFSFGQKKNSNLSLSNPFITPSTVSASSDTTVLFGVTVDGNPDSVTVLVGNVTLGLNDEGLNGDSKKGDKIYCTSISSKSLIPGEYDCEFRAKKEGINSVINTKLKVTP